MIIQFTVENFLSFKEPATLSLAASALKEKQTRSDEIVFELEGTNLSLLKSAVIYGANASGKSNLVKALDFFKWFVINSSKGVQSGESIRVESFRLNRRTEQEPSYFEAVFADETVQYRYGFEVDEKRVHREWLYQKGNKRKAKEVELFLRDGDEYELHPKFSVGKEVVAKKMVRDNALLLSVAAQFNESVSVEIMGWLANTTIVLGSSDERIWEMAIAQIDDPSMKRRIVEFARFADFGIDDIRKVDNTVISSHQQYDEEGNATKTVTFPFRVNESEGTIKYFSLAYPIIDALDHGKRLVVDEFDSKMHPLLTSRIIGLFNCKYSINSLVYWVTYVHNVVYSFYRSMIYCYINSTQRCAGSIVIDIIPTNGADKRKFFPFAPYFPVTNVIKRYFYPYFPAIIGIKGYSFPYFPYLSGIMKIKTALYSLFSRLDWHKTVVFPCLGEIYEGIRSLSWEIPVT